MKYWKSVQKDYRYILAYKISDDNDILIDDVLKNVDMKTQDYIEITKVEYDKAVTLPAMSNNNVIHNYFNGAEQALKLAKTLYIEELGNLIVQGDADASQHYKDFLVYMEAVINVSLDRANTLYDSELAGNTEDVAIGKATAVVIKDDNFAAIAGRDAFLKWAIVKFPQLRTYLNNVNSLKYTTTLTEDEPE